MLICIKPEGLGRPHGIRGEPILGPRQEAVGVEACHLFAGESS